MLGRSARCADSAAVLVPSSRRRTHCAHCVRSVQTAAASQFTKRAARAELGTPLLVAPEIAPAGHRLPRNHDRGTRRFSKGASGQAGARLRGAEKRRACGRARSALRELTRRDCPSVANEVSKASFATGPQARASQGSRSAAETASPKRGGLPRRAFARYSLSHAQPSKTVQGSPAPRRTPRPRSSEGTGSAARCRRPRRSAGSGHAAAPRPARAW